MRLLKNKVDQEQYISRVNKLGIEGWIGVILVSPASNEGWSTRLEPLPSELSAAWRKLLATDPLLIEAVMCKNFDQVVDRIVEVTGIERAYIFTKTHRVWYYLEVLWVKADMPFTIVNKHGHEELLFKEEVMWFNEKKGKE